MSCMFEPISIMFGIREMECSTEDAFSYCLKNTSEESQSVVIFVLFDVENLVNLVSKVNCCFLGW